MSGKRRSVRIGRWCLTVHPYRARRTLYSSGGQRTPGPWWCLDVRWLGDISLSRDRTIFGWGDEANR